MGWAGALVACVPLFILTLDPDVLAAQDTTTTATARPGANQRVTMFTEIKPESALAVALSEIQGMPLTLEEATRAALEGGSTAARRAGAELAAARGLLRRERGAFDPELFLDAERSKIEQSASSPFEGTTTETTTGTGGLRMLLPFGTELEASLDGVRTETNAPFATVNPSYGAFGRLSIRQPLLRGLGPGTGSEAKAVKREAEAAQARYDDVVLGVRTIVEETYWDLYAAERDLAVQRLIRDQAAALARQAELRAQSGLVGPSDVANARVFLAEQEQALLDREESLDQTSDRLARFIGLRPAGGLARFKPADVPPAQFPIEPEQTVVERALRQNRELLARERDLAAARAREQGAAWNRFPQLDLIGSLGGSGLSGTGRTLVFGSDTLSSGITGDFGDAWAQVRDRDFPTWSAGIQLSVPLLLREGRGEHERLRAEAEVLAEELEEGRRIVEEDVRTAHRALVRAARRLEAARNGVDAAAEQTRIGILQYNSGRTTAFELVRLGADLASAQQRFSQALVRTAKAAAALRFLTSSDYAASTPNGGSTRP